MNKIDIISDEVCKYYDITFDRLTEEIRKREVVMPRQMAMKLAREFTKHSFAAIGMYFGGKDHGTVMSAVKTTNNLIETDKSIFEDHRQLYKNVKAIFEGTDIKEKKNYRENSLRRLQKNSFNKRNFN